MGRLAKMRKFSYASIIFTQVNVHFENTVFNTSVIFFFGRLNTSVIIAKPEYYVFFHSSKLKSYCLDLSLDMVYLEFG